MSQHITKPTLEDACESACLALGVTYKPVPMDGRIHTADLDGPKNGKNDGRIKFFTDGEGGIVFNNQTGENIPFFIGDGKPLDDLQRGERDRRRAESIRQHEADERAIHEAAAVKSNSIYDAAESDPATHPYALKKNLDMGPLMRRGDWLKPKWAGALIFPLYAKDGTLATLQAINANGDKSFLEGGKKAGCFYPIGEVRGAIRVYIGEGVATVAAVHAIDGCPCVAAMDAGNLVHVARAVRELAAPGADIIILADNDVKPTGPNTGIDAANKAAAAVSGRVAIPHLDGRKCDFWDLWNERGADALRAAIDGAQGQEPSKCADEAKQRHVIQVIGGTLPEQIELAEKALIDCGADVYQRNAEIVRPFRLSHDLDEKGILIPSGAMVLGLADKHFIAKAMTKAATFTKYDSRAKKDITIDCPMKIAETYLSCSGEWKIPPIIGISECPTMRRDGSLILRSGYDRQSGIFVDYQGKPVQVSENPTKDEAVKALALLKKPFEEFPFLEGMDLSVVLSTVITAVVRRSLPTAPLHAFDAPKAGSGKGLLADAVALIATGRAAAMVSQGRDEAEDEKRLSSMLMRSSPVVCIDNIERPLHGDFLCSMLTQTTVTARILGFSKMVDLSTNSLILATGNNLTFLGDMTRRVMPCRIDPECERPDAREFKTNLKEYIPANRHKLIGAVLTILRRYHLAGRPKQPIKPYGSFEVWSDLVRSALVWLGEADPCDTRRRTEAGDPVTAELSAVLALWAQYLGPEGKTTAEVIELSGHPINADLKNALLEVAVSSKNPEVIDSKRLGHWLKKYEWRVEGGFRIEKTGEDTHTKIAYWRVAKVAGNAGIAGISSQRTRNFGSGDTLPNNIMGLGVNPANPANSEKHDSPLAGNSDAIQRGKWTTTKETLQ